MNVTVAEAALGAAIGGAMITALGGVVTGLVIQRTIRAKDHMVRLWERRAEVYEDVLTHITTTDVKQSLVMTVATFDPPRRSALLAASTGAEVAYVIPPSNLHARLLMYGSERTMKLFSEYSERLTHWLDTHYELLTLEVETYSDAELLTLRECYEAVGKSAAALSQVINSEINSIPKEL